ncbi:MAG: ribulose-phosphate 3-epimerase, partial [Bdellovibrionales bacterium]
GFGGQSFMHDQVEKLEKLKTIRQEKNLKYLIEVDGGVNAQTARLCRSADVLVAGSFVFKGESVADYRQAINMLKEAKND